MALQISVAIGLIGLLGTRDHDSGPRQCNGVVRLAREFDDLPWQHVMFFGPDPDAEVAEGDAGR